MPATLKLFNLRTPYILQFYQGFQRSFVYIGNTSTNIVLEIKTNKFWKYWKSQAHNTLSWVMKSSHVIQPGKTLLYTPERIRKTIKWQLNIIKKIFTTDTLKDIQEKLTYAKEILTQSLTWKEKQELAKARFFFTLLGLRNLSQKFIFTLWDTMTHKLLYSKLGSHQKFKLFLLYIYLFKEHCIWQRLPNLIIYSKSIWNFMQP